MKNLLVALFWLLPVFANASCWEKFATGKDNSTHYIDACSIAVDGVYKKAWFKTELKIPEDHYDGKKFDTKKKLEYFNCKNRKLAAVQFSYYYIDDLVYSSSVKIENSIFDQVTPDSIGESMFERACSSKITKKSKPDVLNREPFDFKNLNDSKECWSYFFTEIEKNDVYINKCSISKLSKLSESSTSNKSYIKIYINSPNNFKGKLLSESGDKEYYDMIRGVFLFNCNSEFAPLMIMPNYYRDEDFVAKTNVPDFFIKFTPDKIKIVNDLLCPILSE